MSYCSVRWCGKNSKTSNFQTDGISFYRFPKEPEIKEQWINCAQRENWFPNKYSVICSRHFTEDCFFNTNNRRRLYKNSIPTLYLPVVCNKIEDSAYPKVEIKPEPSELCQYDLGERIVPPEYLQVEIKVEPLSHCDPVTTTCKRKVTHPETPLQFNSPTKKRLCRRILQLSSEVKKKSKTVKVLRNQVSYYKKRVAYLKYILTDLEKKYVIKSEDADILNKIGVLNKDLKNDNAN